ncbi:putative MFS family arabinose efflux permease [Actinocorallia herbida]|uniref:Putative MFS family arabinose efflux permease n=1 Tax=Actinocorallia herbida TaxID=58109 RepID=A0A3N1D080_9ACTN|nr:MFS transporter [Actinocorallia herbida]ROO86933.1 putative MFS family arabinose efflux permease [Actinocorallia herbida]
MRMKNIPNSSPTEADGQGVRGLSSTAVLALGTFAVGTDAFVTAGFLPSIASSLHVTPSAAGQSITVFAVAYAVLSPTLATATAHVPRRLLLVSALVVLGLANVGSAVAPDFAFFLGSRVIAAFGAAAYTPAAGAVAAALVRPQERARALAVVIGGLTAATALGIPLGGLAARAMGWQAALGLVGAVCLAVAVALRLSMPSLPGSPRTPLRARLAVLRRPGVPAVLPLTVFGMAASYVVYAYSVPVLGAVGTSPSMIVWMLFLYGLGAVIGNLAAGFATDRWSSIHVLTAGYLAMAAGLGVLSWAAATGTEWPALTGLLMLVWGASSWCQTPPQQHRLIALAPHETPLVVGLNASAIYLGIGLGTLLGGLILPAGVPWATAAAALLALLALLHLQKTKHHG